MIRSRLTRRSEQKTIKNFTLSVLGIALIFLLVFKFGIPFLANLSFFLSGTHNKDVVRIQKPSFIAPPVLNSFPQATSSADIIISGIASEKQMVNLYINGVLVNSSESGEDGRFSFTESVKPGENTIKAKAIIDGKESDSSNTIITVFKNAPPSLKIDSPSDNHSFSKDQNIAEIKGTTDQDVRVTVNGLWAITDSLGNFSYSLPLQNGDNKIQITATDAAGNRNKKEINVTYSP